MSLNGYAALQQLGEYIEDKKRHNERISPHEREMLDVVRRDAIHAIQAKVDHNLYTEYDRLKLIELEYMYQVRGVRQVMPSAIFREGYAGYGNSWTGSTIRLLYPQDRKRGGRVSREPVIPIDRLKEITNLSEQLVPLRINLATEKFRLKDRILWNAEDSTIPLEIFVETTLEDYGLPLSLVPTVYRSLQEQITNHLPHIYPVPPEERPDEKPTSQPDNNPSANAPAFSNETAEKSGPEERRFSDERRSSDEMGEKQDSADSNTEDSEMAVEPSETPKTEPHTEKNVRSTDINGTGNSNLDSTTPPTAATSAEVPTNSTEVPTNGVDATSTKDEEGSAPADQPSGAADTNTNEDSATTDASNDTYDEDMRFTIKLDITIGHHQLIDQFEWDINNPENDPEAFGLVLASDMALPLEFSTAISHAIREQIQAYTKALFNSGYQFDGKLPRDTSLQKELAMPVNEHQFLRRPELLPLYTPALADAKISSLDPSAHEQEVERREIRSRRRMGRSSRRGHDTRPGNNPSSNSDVVFLPQEVKGPDFCTPVFSSALPGGLDRNLSILYMTLYHNDESHGGDKQDLVYYFHKQRREHNIPSVSQYEKSMVKFEKPRWIVKLKVPRGLNI